MKKNVTYNFYYYPTRHDIEVEERTWNGVFFATYKQKQYKRRSRIIAWLGNSITDTYSLTLRIGKTQQGKDILTYTNLTKEECYKVLNKFLIGLAPCNKCKCTV